MNVDVVVPTLNAGRTLRRCLESLRSQSIPLRIIVVDGGSSDDTVEIASQLSDQVLTPMRRGVSFQRNLGAQESKASIIGFIDGDMVLDEAVAAQALALIADGAAGVVIPEVSFGTTFWARVRDFERSFYQGVHSPEAARFFVRTAFDEVGGYDERLTAIEDFTLDRAVRANGPIASTRAIIMHDEGHLRYLDACRKKARYATGVLAYSRLYGRRELGSFLLGRGNLRAPFRLMKKPMLVSASSLSNWGSLSPFASSYFVHVGNRTTNAN